MKTGIDKRRRQLMAQAINLAVLSMLPLPNLAVEIEEPELIADPFTLGVASGDPSQDSLIIWTRLASDPLDLASMPKRSLPVKWTVCSDPQCTMEIASGVALAHPHNAHAVHVELRQLQPNTLYYYRFAYKSFTSQIGRAKTLPMVGAKTSSFRFAVASCQSYTDGHFAAYRDLVEQQPDLVIHTGDYIYESDWYGGVRDIPVVEAETLDSYRQLYATYKQDTLLQEAHACSAWVSIWDDHEVDNDWGGKYNQDGISEEEFVKRKVAAFKAYFEHMPLRLAARPQDGNVALYHRLIVGDLVQFDLLDCRQFRDMPACTDAPKLFRNNKAICDQAKTATRSMLGSSQEAWLMRGLGRYQCKWNALIQTTMLAPFDYLNGKAKAFDMDGWDNFAATRQRILDRMKSIGLSNPVSFGGNIHAFYAGVVNQDALDQSANPLLTEIVCTSITSGGGGNERYHQTIKQFEENPFAHYFENRFRGYLLCKVDYQYMNIDMRVVQNIFDPNSPVKTLKKLRVKDGDVGFMS